MYIYDWFVFHFVNVMLQYIRFLQILRNGNSALVKGVLGDGLVWVDRTQTLKGHNLIVSGIASCIFYHIELE